MMKLTNSVKLILTSFSPFCHNNSFFVHEKILIMLVVKKNKSIWFFLPHTYIEYLFWQQDIV